MQYKKCWTQFRFISTLKGNGFLSVGSARLYTQDHFSLLIWQYDYAKVLSHIKLK